MDLRRNTPLHIIVSYPKPISDFMTLHSIIMTLIEAGAHMDAVNSFGETPFETATTGLWWCSPLLAHLNLVKMSQH